MKKGIAYEFRYFHDKKLSFDKSQPISITEFNELYDIFIAKYDKKHKKCPVCNNNVKKPFYRTAANIISADFKEINVVDCECGWSGVIHKLN